MANTALSRLRRRGKTDCIKGNKEAVGMQGADYVIRTPVGLRLDHFLFLQELMGCFGFFGNGDHCWILDSNGDRK